MDTMQIYNAEAVCVFDDPKIGSQYTSFSPDDMDGKIKLYNAINSPEKRIGDFINSPIDVQDVVVMAVKLTNKFSDAQDDKSGDNPFKEDDDKLRDGFRVVLIDTDGVSYTATSNGIYNSIKTMRAVFGTLHFENGLKVTVRQVKAKNGNTLTLSLK